jgi:putative membrane protein
MLLSPQDHQRIEQATAAAEATTRGEIVCVVADEAAPYMEVPLAWAAAGALVLPLIPLSLGALAAHFDDGLRGWSVAHIAATHATVATALGAYALLQCMLFIAIALLASIPAVRRFLTPGSLKRGHVHQRALEQFFARDMHTTRERTGVLIYASLKDRRAEVVADTGINAKVGSQAWDGVITQLVTGMKAGEPGNGFVAAIEASGRLLATHFPAERDNPNELPNAITETAGP